MDSSWGRSAVVTGADGAELGQGLRSRTDGGRLSLKRADDLSDDLHSEMTHAMEVRSG